MSEALKNFSNRGAEPDFYFFWRDSAGLEFDLLIDQGAKQIPIEIKFGQTVASDNFADLVDAALLGDGLLADVQAEQNRETEEFVLAERELVDHAQHAPTTSPVGQRLLPRADQRIVMHPHAVDFESALACQRVVDGQHDLVLVKPRGNQHEHQQAQFVQRPLGTGDNTMKRGAMLGGHDVGGQVIPVTVRRRAKTQPESTNRKLCNFGWVITEET